MYISNHVNFLAVGSIHALLHFARRVFVSVSCARPAMTSCSSCLQSSPSSPAFFEASVLPGFLGYARNPDGGEDPNPAVVVIRLTRARGTVAIGTAPCTSTGVVEGFLAVMALGGGGCVTAAPLLTQKPSGQTHRLTSPRSVVLLSPGCAIVVGSGVVQDTLTGDVLSEDDAPAVARVTWGAAVTGAAAAFSQPRRFGPGGGGVGGACCAVPACDSSLLCVDVVVGNGSNFRETYTDVIVGPPATACAPCPFLYVTSIRYEDFIVEDDVVLEKRTSLVRKLDAATLQPVGVGPTLNEPYTEISFETSPLDTDLAVDRPDNEPVSLTLSPGPGCALIAIAVQATVGGAPASLVWPLRADDLVQVLPWSATGFNDPETGLLRAMSTTEVSALRILTSPATAATYVVADVALAIVNAPVHAAQIYKFSPDTNPEYGFGVSGVTTWFDAASGSTRPTDAALGVGTAAGLYEVYVVGNTYTNEATPGADGSYQFVVPGFAYLNVAVPDGVVPAPFLLAVRDTPGCSGPVIPRPILTNVCGGCAPIHFASTYVPGVTTGDILGDSVYHGTCPSQTPYVLDVALALSGVGTCRVSNGGRASVPCVTCACDGYVTVDALCAPATVLRVAGPVVLGCETPALPTPGMLRFNATEARFEGYDGTQWVVFQATPP